MKTRYITLLFLTFFLATCKVFASDFEVDGFAYTYTDPVKLEVRIDGATNKESITGELTIPETVEYSDKVFTVRSIGNNAFNGYTNITSVTIPDAITTLGSNCFAGCTALTSVTLGKGITTMAGGTFNNCKQIENVYSRMSAPPVTYLTFATETYIYGTLHIPYGCSSSYSKTTPWSSFSKIVEDLDTGTDNTKITKDGITYSIYDDNKLKAEEVNLTDMSADIVIPASIVVNEKEYIVKDLGKIFDSNNKVVSLKISEGVENIYRISSCSNLKNLSIPHTLTFESALLNNLTLTSLYFDSPQSGFAFPGNMETLTIGSHVENIRDNFLSLGSAENIIIEEGVKSIGNFAFSGKSILKHVELPASLESIGNSAFSNCSNLNHIELPASLKTIGEQAFYASGLTELILPDTNLEIGKYAFVGSKIERLRFGANVNGDDGNINDLISLNPIKYFFINCKNPKGAIDTSADVEELVFGDNVVNIGEQLFSYRVSIKSVTFGKSVKTIGSYSFENYTGTTLTIPDNIETINYWAFSKMPELVELHIGSGIKTIGDYNWQEAPKLKNLYCDATTPPALVKHTFLNTDRPHCNLYVPAESIALYREANVWKEFNILPADMDSFKEDIKKDIDNLKTERDKKGQEIKDLEDDIKNIQEKYDNNKKRIDELQNTLDELQQRLNDSNLSDSEKAEIQKMIDDANTELATLNTENENIKTELDKASSDLEKAKEAYEEISKTIDGLEKELEDANTLDDIQKVIDEINNEKNKLDDISGLNDISNTLDDLDKRADDVANGLDGINTDIGICNKKLDDLVTGILSTLSHTSISHIYSIGGQKQTRIKRGINLIITSKGETKKVIAK